MNLTQNFQLILACWQNKFPTHSLKKTHTQQNQEDKEDSISSANQARFSPVQTQQ